MLAVATRPPAARLAAVTLPLGADPSNVAGWVGRARTTFHSLDRKYLEKPHVRFLRQCLAVQGDEAVSPHHPALRVFDHGPGRQGGRSTERLSTLLGRDRGGDQDREVPPFPEPIGGA